MKRVKVSGKENNQKAGQIRNYSFKEYKQERVSLILSPENWKKNRDRNKKIEGGHGLIFNSQIKPELKKTNISKERAKLFIKKSNRVKFFDTNYHDATENQTIDLNFPHALVFPSKSKKGKRHLKKKEQTAKKPSKESNRLPAFDLNMNVTAQSFKKLPNSLVKFLKRFKQKIAKDFPDNLRISFTETQNFSRVKLSILDQKSQDFLKWLKEMEHDSERKLLDSLGFHKNYRLVLKNVFGEDSLKVRNYSRIIHKHLRSKLKNYVLAKLGRSINFQRNCCEVILILFLLHLDVPRILRQELTDQSLLLIIMVLFSFCFEIKEILAYVQSIPARQFRESSIFDVDFTNPLSAGVQRLVYYCCWYLTRVLSNFRHLTSRANQFVSKNKRIGLLKRLFQARDARSPQFEFSESLSDLIRSIDFETLQQFFLFIKNKLIKAKPDSDDQPSRSVKSILYYVSGNAHDAGRMDVHERSLNLNIFRALRQKRTSNHHPLRKMKRHQEMCIYMGPRLKNFVMKKASGDRRNSESENFFFSVSEESFERLRTQSGISTPSLEQINYLLNQKILSTYKIPIYLFQCLMCTNEFDEHSGEFFRSEFVRAEIDQFFLKTTVLTKNFEPGEILEMVIVPQSKSKFPWSMMEVLTIIPYVCSLEKTIKFKYLMDKTPN